MSSDVNLDISNAINLLDRTGVNLKRADLGIQGSDVLVLCSSTVLYESTVLLFRMVALHPPLTRTGFKRYQ